MNTRPVHKYYADSLDQVLQYVDKIGHYSESAMVPGA